MFFLRCGVQWEQLRGLLLHPLRLQRTIRRTFEGSHQPTLYQSNETSDANVNVKVAENGEQRERVDQRQRPRGLRPAGTETNQNWTGDRESEPRGLGRRRKNSGRGFVEVRDVTVVSSTRDDSASESENFRGRHPQMRILQDRVLSPVEPDGSQEVLLPRSSTGRSREEQLSLNNPVRKSDKYL